MPAVLVVDDDADTVESLHTLLSGEGWKVHTAGTGHEATQVLRTVRLDGIVSDHHLPDMAGAGLLALASQVQPEARRVLFSGSGEVPTDGPYTLVRKPDVVSLLEILREATRTRTGASGPKR